MKIGQYEVNLLDAGRFRLDGGAMFGVVPKNLWAGKIPSDEHNRIQMAANLLLIRGEGEVIIIDTGLGEKMNDKLSSIYAIDHGEFSLEKGLRKYGLTAADISAVILTHLHFDHAGGATVRDVDGAIKPAFPNATYFVQERQYHWALAPSEKDQASFFDENYVPLEKSGQLQQLSSCGELFPGIEVVPVEGHTVGQQMVLITGRDRSLLYAADLFPTSRHVPVPWVMAYDLYPMITVVEKKQYLARAVQENWLIFFEHDPEVHCAGVKKTDRGFALGEAVDLS